MLVEQVRHFGPFSDSFEEVADAEHLAICTGCNCLHTGEPEVAPVLHGPKTMNPRGQTGHLIVRTMKLDLQETDRRQGSFCKVRGSIHEAAKGSSR